MKIIDKFNEWYFEKQIRKQFKPPKLPKVIICEHCGKIIVKGTKRKPGDDYGSWVMGDGTATYHHDECENYVDEKRQEAIKGICPCYGFDIIEPGIERCIICPKSSACDVVAALAIENAKEVLRGLK